MSRQSYENTVIRAFRSELAAVVERSRLAREAMLDCAARGDVDGYLVASRSHDDAEGEVVRLKYATRAVRSMPASELCSRIIDTRARLLHDVDRLRELLAHHEQKADQASDELIAAEKRLRDYDTEHGDKIDE